MHQTVLFHSPRKARVACEVGCVDQGSGEDAAFVTPDDLSAEVETDPNAVLLVMPRDHVESFPDSIPQLKSMVVSRQETVVGVCRRIRTMTSRQLWS